MTRWRLWRFAFLAILMAHTAAGLAGIALIQRASETLGKVHKDNVVSLFAYEQMLAILIDLTAAPEQQQRFREHLQLAHSNVTEPEELFALGVIEANIDDALAGPGRARSSVVQALARLGAANRGAIVRSDQEARATGSAGTWALALMTLLGIGLTSLIANRFGRGIIEPLMELSSVLRAQGLGERGRRTAKVGGPEWLPVMTALDELLDRQTSVAARASDDLRPVLSALLDKESAPLVLLNAAGARLVANQAALDYLATGAEAPEQKPANSGSASSQSALIWGQPQGLRLVRLETD